MARKKAAVTTGRAKKAVAAPVEIVEEVGGGLGVEGGMVITTAIFLIIALVMVIVALGRYPGQ